MLRLEAKSCGTLLRGGSVRGSYLPMYHDRAVYVFYAITDYLPPVSLGPCLRDRDQQPSGASVPPRAPLVYCLSVLSVLTASSFSSHDNARF